MEFTKIPKFRVKKSSIMTIRDYHSRGMFQNGTPADSRFRLFKITNDRRDTWTVRTRGTIILLQPANQWKEFPPNIESK